MTTWELIAERAKKLPPEKQQEVLDFVEFIHLRVARPRKLHDLEGLWQGFDVSPEDVEEARREMWGRFSLDDV
jgi:hypothetical protein